MIDDKGVRPIFQTFCKRPATVGTEPVQTGDNGLTTGAARGGPLQGALLSKKQPVGGHAKQTAHLCQIGHIWVCLSALPFAYRLPGDA